MVATLDIFTIALDIFAVVGAMATVGGLGWRIYTWRHDRVPHVQVKISNAFPTFGPNNERMGDWRFSVVAVNRSDHAVNATSAGFLLPDGRDLVIIKQPFPGAIPTTIAPHDSAQTWIGKDEFERKGHDAAGMPLTGWVHLSTGERFESKPTVLVAAARAAKAA